MLNFLFGRVLMRGAAADAVKILNIGMKKEIPFKNYYTKEQFFYVELSERSASRLLREADGAAIALQIVKRRGFPQLCRRYGRRVGLLTGGILSVMLLFLSSRVVWDVRVTGNQVFSDQEIEAMLSECGLGIGTYLPTLDSDLVEMRLLLSHREICWVSVNIRGTTANVEILETVKGEVERGRYANLVASRDGQIERIEAYDGNLVVRVGEVVKEGDLLVSGVYDTLRATRASGAIYARTVRTFEVEIPLVSCEILYTGREWREIYVNFFSKRIKVFANTGKRGEVCDIIYHNNGVVLPNGAYLPIGSEEIVWREYTEQEVSLTEQEAMEAAFAALADQLSAFVSETGAELLGKNVTFELDEQAYRLRCSVICIENIAVVQEFDIN